MLRSFREGRGLRQDDLARAARQTGLPWTRSIVVALEAGRRDLSIDEFVRLPLIFEHLGIGTPDVELKSVGANAYLRVAGDHMHVDLSAPWAGSLAATARVSRAMEVAFPWTRGKRELAPAYEAAGGDLEQKVGRQQELDPLIVALIAQATWGRSLTAERDHRVAEQAPAGTTPRVVQALRGHVTRALLEELGPRLAEAQKSSRRKRRPR